MDQKEILWLASWYPNEKNPVAGDFIQRHAQSVSAFCKLTVIYMDQSGWYENQTLDRTDIQTNENFTEIRCYFPFKKTGFQLADRILYNLKFMSRYKRLLENYIAENGKPELIHVHVPMKAGKLAVWAKRKWDIPYILSEQASTYLEKAPDYFYHRSSYYQQTVKKIFRESSAVTNVSMTVGKILEKIMGVSNIRTIHNTVNQHFFFFKNQARQTFRFIHVSSLNKQKNITGLLKAFQALASIRNDWELRLTGPVSPELQLTIEQMKKFYTLTCTGEIPYAMVACEMQEASAFVLFSNHENFPCVIAEALCCGLPVITSNAGGAGESIDEHNGIVVPVGDEQKLLIALIQMLDNYFSYNRNVISIQAIEKCGYPHIGQQFAELYTEIVKGG